MTDAIFFQIFIFKYLKKKSLLSKLENKINENRFY